MNKELLEIKIQCAVEVLDDQVKNKGSGNAQITMKFLDKAFALGRVSE